MVYCSVYIYKDMQDYMKEFIRSYATKEMM